MTGFSVNIYTTKISLCPCTLMVCQIKLTWIFKSTTVLLGNSSGWLLASVHAGEGKVNKKWDQEGEHKTGKHELLRCLALVLLSTFLGQASRLLLFPATPLLASYVNAFWSHLLISFGTDLREWGYLSIRIAQLGWICKVLAWCFTKKVKLSLT